jgi:hypothetical protein
VASGSVGWGFEALRQQINEAVNPRLRDLALAKTVDAGTWPAYVDALRRVAD